MIGSRPRGRAGTLAVVPVLAIAVALTQLQGSSLKSAYGRPLELLPHATPANHTVAASIWTETQPAAPWEVLRPGSNAAIVPVGRNPVHVPILMYHYIRPAPERASDPIGWGLSTPPDDFRAQMDYLERNNYHPVTLTDLRAYLNGARPLPTKPVVLTFDDGYEDFYTTAFPVLKQHGFTAVAYVVSGFVGRPGNLSAAQVRELDAYGIEIGAHTVNHVDLTKQSPAGLAFEVKGSKGSLEAIVGHPVLDFCYPSGKNNPQVQAAVQQAGFLSATSVEPGATHSLADSFAWTRVRVFGSEPMPAFITGLAQHEDGLLPVSVSPIQVPRVFPLTYVPSGLATE